MVPTACSRRSSVSARALALDRVAEGARQELGVDRALDQVLLGARPASAARPTGSSSAPRGRRPRAWPAARAEGGARRSRPASPSDRGRRGRRPRRRGRAARRPRGEVGGGLDVPGAAVGPARLVDRAGGGAVSPRGGGSAGGRGRVRRRAYQSHHHFPQLTPRTPRVRSVTALTGEGRTEARSAALGEEREQHADERRPPGPGSGRARTCRLVLE